jgi:hypothetical protein
MAGQQEGCLAEAPIADGSTVRAGPPEQPPQEIIDSPASVTSIVRCLQRPVPDGGPGGQPGAPPSCTSTAGFLFGQVKGDQDVGSLPLPVPATVAGACDSTPIRSRRQVALPAPRSWRLLHPWRCVSPSAITVVLWAWW